VLKPDAPTLHCKNPACTRTDDLETCAGRKGRCSLYTCPPLYMRRHNASNILCEEAACNSTNHHTCCAARGKCSTFRCPSERGLVNKWTSDHISCHGFGCSMEKDVFTCCDEVANCTTIGVPDGFALKAKAAQLRCKSVSCGKEDEETCLDPVGTCSTMTCPPTELHRADASKILCSDRDCSETNVHVCCGDAGKCHTLPCPSGFVPRPLGHNLSCQG
jgi:hypothetical protein